MTERATDPSPEALEAATECATEDGPGGLHLVMPQHQIRRVALALDAFRREGVEQATPSAASHPEDPERWEIACRIYGFVCAVDPVTLTSRQQDIVYRAYDALDAFRRQGIEAVMKRLCDCGCVGTDYECVKCARIRGC